MADHEVERAVSLTSNHATRARLRSELRGRLERLPVVDARRFTAALEVAYRAIWEATQTAGTSA